MITQRSLVLGFVGVCFYLIALVNTLPPYYYALAWLALGLLVSSWGIALLSLIGVDCSWSNERTTATESVPGQDESAPLLNVVLANRGGFSKTGLVIEVQLKSLGGALPAGEVVVQRIYVEALPAETSIASRLPLRTLPRGRYQLDQVRLVGSDVLGLFRARRRLEAMSDSNEIVVGPGVVHLGAATVSQSGRTGRRLGNIEARYRVGQGDDLRGTRPYAPGDDLRRVHWKSTARAGELVVKEFHHRGRNSSAVAWDGASGTDWGEGEATEWALRLVVSLHHAIASSGAPCDLLTLQSKNVLVETELTSQRLVTVLADAAPDRDLPLAVGINILPADYQEIYLVSASVSPDLVRLVEQCCSRRVRVTVILLNAEMFADAQFGGHFGRSSQGAVQNIRPQGQPPDGDEVPLPARAADFSRQAELVVAAGATVVLAGPHGPEELENFGPRLSSILAESLHRDVRLPRQPGPNAAATAAKTGGRIADAKSRSEVPRPL